MPTLSCDEGEGEGEGAAANGSGSCDMTMSAISEGRFFLLARFCAADRESNSQGEVALRFVNIVLGMD
jgi:hypothetical protein